MVEYFFIEVIEGVRVTLLFLSVLIAALLGFYWTR